MLTLLLHSLLLALCVSAKSDLVDTFLRTMDSPLSSLSYADAVDSFHVVLMIAVWEIDCHPHVQLCDGGSFQIRFLLRPSGWWLFSLRVWRECTVFLERSFVLFHPIHRWNGQSNSRHLQGVASALSQSENRSRFLLSCSSDGSYSSGHH